MEAFKSLQEFQDDILDNHKQIHDLILDNYTLLKKGRFGMTKTAIKRAQKNGEEMAPRQTAKREQKTGRTQICRGRRSKKSSGGTI